MNLKNYFLAFRVIFLFYSILLVIGVLYHEPWRDEAHVWIAARDNTLLQSIVDLRYEGTPLLWTLVLMPFAKLSMPYISMSLVHAGLAILAVGLLLFHSKLPRLTKVLFAFSYYMAYEYAVIARNYTLTIVLLFSIASIHHKRFNQPIIYATLVSLLFQTNSFSIAPALILAILFASKLLTRNITAIKKIVPIVILGIGTIFTIGTLLPDMTLPYMSYPPTEPISQLTRVIRYAIVPMFDKFPLPFMTEWYIDAGILVLTSVSLLAFGIYSLNDKTIFLATMISFGWIIFINTMIHAGGLRHFGLLLVYLVFFFWLMEEHPMKKNIYRGLRMLCLGTLNLLLALSWIFTIYMYKTDFHYDFSGAKNMATYILRHNLSDLDIVGYTAPVVEAVVPYLGRKQLWYPETETTKYINVTDIKYYIRTKDLTFDIALERINNNFPPGRRHLLLLSFPFTGAQTHGYKLIHTSRADEMIYQENYWLYERI